MKSGFSILLFFTLSCSLLSQPDSSDVEEVLRIVNKLRSRGCKCGEKFMPPAGALSWDKQLYEVSNRYARYMKRYHHFDHISLEGKDLGDRLDEIHYPWERIGENLGVGYNDFFKVLQAWIDSPGHCEMLLDPHFTRFGMSKHKEYWVQSFAKELPSRSFVNSAN